MGTSAPIKRVMDFPLVEPQKALPEAPKPVRTITVPIKEPVPVKIVRKSKYAYIEQSIQRFYE